MAHERVYVFQHVECETLGTFAGVLAACGLRAEYVRLFAGDPCPGDWRGARALIVLGGPMSVHDAPRYPYLTQEQAILREALAAQTPILGVCLGAQLLAVAAGARVVAAAQPEVGWAPVSLTPAGHSDRLLAPLAQLAAVFHWHGETFELPVGATRLASSALTANQGIRIGQHAYGLQFHLEVDPPMIESWLHAYPQDLGTDPSASIRRIAADTARHADALRAVAGTVLSGFAEVALGGGH